MRQLCFELFQLGRHGGLGGPQFKCERDETLLRAVVQIALDAAAGLVGGGDNTGAGGSKLGAADLQRAPHGVEGAGEHVDLARAGFGHAHGEIAAGHFIGHDGRTAKGPDDGPPQVTREENEEEDRSDETGRRRHDRLPAVGLGAVQAVRDDGAFGRLVEVEFVPDGSEALHSVFGRGQGPSGIIVSPDCIDQRNRVLPDVRRAALGDPPSPARLLGVAGAARQSRSLVGKLSSSSLPRRQQTLLPRDDEPPLGGLDVGEELPQPGHDRELPTGLAGHSPRIPQIVDREDQGRKGATDDDHQQAVAMTVRRVSPPFTPCSRRDSVGGALSVHGGSSLTQVVTLTDEETFGITRSRSALRPPTWRRA